MTYQVHTNANIFTNLKHIPAETIKEEEIFVKQQDKKYKQIDYTYLENFVKNFESQNIHPLKLVDTTLISTDQFLFGVLFDLCRRQETYFTEDTFYIAKDIHFSNETERKIIYLLLKMMDYTELKNIYEIKMDDFINICDPIFIEKLEEIQDGWKPSFSEKELNSFYKKFTYYFKHLNYDNYNCEEELTIEDCIHYIYQHRTIEYSKILYISCKYKSDKTIYSQPMGSSHNNIGSGGSSGSSGGGGGGAD